MFVYNIKYTTKTIHVESDEEEMTSKRLKNQILMHIDKLSYDNLKLFMVEDFNAFALDDNEIVDFSQDFILEVH